MAKKTAKKQDAPPARIMCAGDVVPIATLTRDPRNARKHGAKNLKAIRDSLARFGQRRAILVADGVVIAGNGTLASAVDLGWTEIATVDASDMSEQDRRAYAIADNRTAELAEWDDEELARTLRELVSSGSDLASLGFTDDDLRVLEGGLPADADGKEYDETVVTLVKRVTCPNCKHEFPA